MRAYHLNIFLMQLETIRACIFIQNDQILYEHTILEKSNINYQDLELKSKEVKEVILFRLKNMFTFE